MASGPTCLSELKRGLNGFNLAVGGATAAGIGFLLWLALADGLLPPLVSGPPVQVAALAALALFVGITAVHAGAHAYMGWHLSRGISALRAGRPAEAARWLSLVRRPGMDHYDIEGVAQASLEQALATLSPPGGDVTALSPPSGD
ncbi:MAG TPA: hypothetical protein VGO93_13225 [Candidatus Xenobia bacterium]|jgi:hypothetical protein